MTAATSAQTRKNRAAAGRKAAAAVRAGRRDGRYGPDGSARGSDPVAWDFGAVLARVNDAAQRQRATRGG